LPTESAGEALKILRDPSQFQWYIIPLLAIAIFVYSNEIEKKNWNTVFAGLAFWGMDWFNEIWNALVFHFTNHAPVWGAPGKTAFLILIGLNIEICFMFSIAGIAMTKMLIMDKKAKVLGIPNRLFFAVLGSVFCVFVECVLNAAGRLTWDYPWWSIRVPWLVFIIGYMPFFLVSYYVYDLKTVKSKIAVVGTIYTVVISSLIIFGVILKWI